MIQSTSLKSNTELIVSGQKQKQLALFERLHNQAREKGTGLADFEIADLLNVPCSTISARRNDSIYEFVEVDKTLNPDTDTHCHQKGTLDR